MIRVASLRPTDSAVAEEVEVPLLQIDPDDAVGDRDVLDLMERVPKLEHPGGREEVARVRVGVGEDRRALSEGVERKVIDRFDERVRPVAPIDAGSVDDPPVDVEALGRLDALRAKDFRSDDRPSKARTTVMQKASA
jgi:hypothetical protein